MKRAFFAKTVFSFALALAVFSCKNSNYFAVTEQEQYLLNLKTGVLDTPALTVHHLAPKIYFSSSYAQDGAFLYDFEILSVWQGNKRSIKELDDFNMVFSADIQKPGGGAAACSVKGLKIVLPQKEISFAAAKSVAVKNGVLDFAQEIPLNNLARGQSCFKIILTLQTQEFEQLAVVPATPEAEHLKSQNILIEYLPYEPPPSDLQTVTLTFKDQDGAVFKTLTGTPFEELSAPVLPAPDFYEFVAWKNLPALFPQQDAVYEPVLAPIKYSITYHLDGGANSRGNPRYYTVETPTFSFLDAAKHGYAFEGWYKDRLFNERITRIEQGSNGDIGLYAKYSEIVEGTITLDKEYMELVGGGTAQLNVTLELSDGTTPPALWTSSNEAVATVDSLGNVTAQYVQKPTTVLITASYSNLKASCLVKVLPAP